MMKKFLALLLAAMMTLSTASASLLFGEPDDKQLPPETPAAAVAPVSLAALDAAFERGKVSLVPVEQPEGERLYSLSPAGNSALILTDDGLVAEYGGVRNPVHMAEERGVPDTYGNLATFCRMQPVQLLGEESVVYSPDGRYAAINNSYYVLMSMRAFFDPILIDLSTGEVFLAATYPNKMRDENMGMVTTGSFSADGKYYYYMVYGSIVMQGSRMKLFRYDMATGVLQRL